MADPAQPLQDQLLVRCLQKKLTDSLAFDRVSRFDSARLGMEQDTFLERLDKWLEHISAPQAVSTQPDWLVHALAELERSHRRIEQRIDKLEASSEPRSLSSESDEYSILLTVTSAMNKALESSRTSREFDHLIEQIAPARERKPASRER